MKAGTLLRSRCWPFPDTRQRPGVWIAVCSGAHNPNSPATRTCHGRPSWTWTSRQSRAPRNPLSLAPAAPEPTASLLLHAAGLDQLRPFLFVLVDEIDIIFRRARRDLGAVIAELLFHLGGGERVAQRLVESV